MRDHPLRGGAIGIVVLVLALAVAAPALALGPNLVTDSQFDLGLSGWTGLNLTWVPGDVHGNPHSGSLRLLVPAGVGSAVALGSCVPVTPGQTYLVAGWAWVEPGSAQLGALFDVLYYAGSSCSGSTVGTGSASPDAMSAAWQHQAAATTAPANAHSAYPQVVVRHDTGSTYSGAITGYFDDLYFGTTGCDPRGLADLCLQHEQFQVEATFVTAGGVNGTGTAVPFSDGAGSFWFFSPDNLELDVKVIDGCAFNNHYWVYAAGLTDVRVHLVVRDLRHPPNAKVYDNPANHVFTTITDSAAFPCN